MPASYVHQCVAEQAVTAALPSYRPFLSAVLAGAEGPDPLFFSIAPGNPYPPKVGSTIHTQKTAQFLCELCTLSAPSELLRAYCCGFFTHYATDSTCHPFICAHALTEEGTYSGTEHCLLEHSLETLHYRRTGHKTGLPVQMAGFAALTGIQKDEIADMLSAAIAKVFPDSALSTRAVRRSFDDAVHLCRALRSESGVKYHALGGVLAPLGLSRALHAHMMPLELPDEDIANDAHAPWASIWKPDEIRHESFDDLFRMSIARAGELILCADGVMRGCMSLDSLRMLTGDNSYASGLPWQSSCAPRDAPGVKKKA